MTLAQLRLFLKHGSRVARKNIVLEARTTRAAMWAEQDSFESQLKPLGE